MPAFILESVIKFHFGIIKIPNRIIPSISTKSREKISFSIYLGEIESI